MEYQKKQTGLTTIQVVSLLALGVLAVEELFWLTTSDNYFLGIGWFMEAWFGGYGHDVVDKLWALFDMLGKFSFLLIGIVGFLKGNKTPKILGLYPIVFTILRLLLSVVMGGGKISMAELIFFHLPLVVAGALLFFYVFLGKEFKGGRL
ncbi:hypothetical protein [Streptococcus merionis]|uniref:hypothetical protein n=1 Tax=Streptococcus merionis TaxID=400065 RepID=UPI003511F93E